MVELYWTRAEIGRLTMRDFLILSHERNPTLPAGPKIETAAEAKAHKARILARRRALAESWEP